MEPTKEKLLAELVVACDAVTAAAKKSHDPNYIALGEDLRISVERYKQATKQTFAG